MGRQIIKQIHEIKNDLHDKLKSIRCLQRIVDGDAFINAWKSANDTGKLAAQVIIEWNDRDELLKWVARYRTQQLGELGVRALQKIASRLHIQNYARLSKVHLLSSIVAKEKKYEEGRYVITDGGIVEDNEPNDCEIKG
jgi:hypothetical protein